MGVFIGGILTLDGSFASAICYDYFGVDSSLYYFDHE
jgi:hypothetical protein